MDYVVNPGFIYLLQVIDCFRNVLIASLSILIIVACIYGTLFSISTVKCCWLKDSDEDCNKRLLYFRPRLFLSILFSLIISFLICVVPSSKTLIAMEVSKHVTYTNIDKAKIEVKNAIDYIFTKINNEITNK